MNELDTEGLPPEEKPAPHNPTAKELGDLVNEIFDQKVKIEDMEKLVSAENKKLALLEQKATAWLDELEWEKFQHERGTIFVKEDWRFSLPPTDEAKAEFFGWLKAQGLYDKYATVHSTAYNSLLLKEWEVAKEEGRGMDFHIPGVPEPKFYRSLRTLKGNKS